MSIYEIYKPPLHKKLTSLQRFGTRRLSNPRQVLKKLNNSNNLKNDLSFDIQNNLMINLEDLIVIERELAYLIDHFSVDPSSERACATCWAISNDNTLNGIDSLFLQQKLKGCIKTSLLQSCMLPGLLLFIIYNGRVPPDIITLVKTLCFHYHQAFLYFSQYVISRIPTPSSNTYMSSLVTIINTKKLPHSSIGKLQTFRNDLNMTNINLKKLIKYQLSIYSSKQAKFMKNAILKIIKANTLISVSECRFIIEEALGFIPTMPAIVEESQQISIPESTKPYTLVLDMDETLIHFNDGLFEKRPFLDEFLREASAYYELIVFTAGLKDYADWVLDQADPEKLIAHRLYRENTVRAGTFFIKDLEVLGRDLSKVIIVDNTPENFQLQPENGILIKSWFDDPEDFALKELGKLLRFVATEGVQDVRDTLKAYRQQVLTEVGPSLTRENLT